LEDGSHSKATLTAARVADDLTSRVSTGSQPLADSAMKAYTCHDKHMRSFTLDRSLGFLVNRVALSMKDALDRELRPYNVTPEQWAVLNRLWEEEGRSQKELAERTFKDEPNTARIVAKLERKDLVFRRPDPTDRRAVQVFLTERGRNLRPQLVPLAESVNQRARHGLTDEELATLVKLLDRVYTNLP
jgi:DNA-binding MarR family transcriptional regulator